MWQSWQFIEEVNINVYLNYIIQIKACTSIKIQSALILLMSVLTNWICLQIK